MKTFEQWLADFCVGGVQPAPIAKDYLQWYFNNRDAKWVTPIKPGFISNNDVYNRAMREIANLSETKFKDKGVVLTDAMEFPIYSDIIETDELHGVCEDNDVNSIRFIRHMTKEQIGRAPDGQDHPKLVKKKSGAFLRELVETICPELPESVKNWLSEMFKAKTYACRAYKDYELHLTKEFWRIYDPNWCDGNFGSCMAHNEFNGNWTFYYNSVDAHAAYITRKGSRKIVARCIRFDSVRDDNTGLTYRYAERQYSGNTDISKMNILIDMLKAAGEIDINKVPGSGCSERTRIVNSYTGASMSGCRFSIRCSLINGDNISYQDSFGFYSPREHRAYNYEATGAQVCISTTSSWYYNESTQNRRPSDYSWNVDNFHRCYTKYDDGQYVSVNYYTASGTKSSTRMCTRFDDVVNVNGEMWYRHDVVYDDVVNAYFPKDEMGWSAIENRFVPYPCSVELFNGDRCYKRNAVCDNNIWYHQSSVIKVPCIKGIAIKELCTFIDGVPYPGDENHVKKVGRSVKVLTKQNTWRNIELTEWDGDGFYDTKAYVDAVCPVWDKESRKHVIGTRKVRPEMAFKMNGRWYDNATCHYDFLTHDVHVKMPHKAFPYTDIHGDGVKDMFVCISDKDWKQYEDISNMLLMS